MKIIENPYKIFGVFSAILEIKSYERTNCSMCPTFVCL